MCETLIGKASKTSNKNSENEPKHTNTKMPHNYKSMQVRGLTVCVCERTETAAVSAAVLLRGLPTLFCGLPFSMLMICKHKHKRTNTKPRSQKQNSKNTTIITAHRKYAPYTTAVAKKKRALKARDWEIHRKRMRGNDRINTKFCARFASMRATCQLKICRGRQIVG